MLPPYSSYKSEQKAKQPPQFTSKPTLTLAEARRAAEARKSKQRKGK